MFHAATGHTPHQHLLGLRLERARALLRQRMSLIDIADTCGFSSHARMSKIFREKVGQTPLEFRRNLRTGLYLVPPLEIEQCDNVREHGA